MELKIIFDYGQYVVLAVAVLYVIYQAYKVNRKDDENYSFDTDIGEVVEQEDRRESEEMHRSENEEMNHSGDEATINIQEMKEKAKWDENGNYISDYTKPYGSFENPVIVGMPDCSNSLQYDIYKKRWVLTDGLGNGWLR